MSSFGKLKYFYKYMTVHYLIHILVSVNNRYSLNCLNQLMFCFLHFVFNRAYLIDYDCCCLQNDTVVLSEITVHTNTNSLDKVLQHYKRLVTFTLERFAVSIKDIICEA